MWQRTNKILFVVEELAKHAITKSSRKTYKVALNRLLDITGKDSLNISYDDLLKSVLYLFNNNYSHSSIQQSISALNFKRKLNDLLPLQGIKLELCMKAIKRLYTKEFVNVLSIINKTFKLHQRYYSSICYWIKL